MDVSHGNIQASQPEPGGFTGTPGGAASLQSIRKIRLLFFVKEPFPTSRVDVDVLFGRELIRRGHEIDFVVQSAKEGVPSGPQQWRGRTVWIGATDCGDGFAHRLRKHLLGVWHDLRSLRLASADRYDALQVRDKLIVAAIGVVTARLKRLKFFYWLSFPHAEAQVRRALDGTARYAVLSYLQGKLSAWLLYGWILPRSTHVFVQSEQMRKDVSAHGISASKLTSVPMGIADDDLQTVHDGVAVRRVRDFQRITLAYLGTLNAQRRLEMLVDMLQLVVQRGVDAELLLIGDGERPEDRLRLERRASELGIRERLEITGFLPRSEALRRARSADVCLSPFFPTPILRSTSPTKLVEYLALGIPVVANDHPEQRRVLRASRAGICVPWGARYFARAVIWLLRKDALERIAMGERGQCWVRQHRTYARIAGELERTYFRLLSRSRRPKRRLKA